MDLPLRTGKIEFGGSAWIPHPTEPTAKMRTDNDEATLCRKVVIYILFLILMIAASEVYLASLWFPFRIGIFIVILIGMYQDECGIRASSRTLTPTKKPVRYEV